MSGLSRRMVVTGAAAWCVPGVALAQSGPLARFSTGELIDSGHKFFGTVSRGLAQVVEEAGRRWGQPNGYVLGQEAGAALIGGLRYGEGTMYTRNAGDLHLYWEGPSARLRRGWRR